MSQTLERNETIEAAKAEFLRAKNRLARDLETTPDDRINWSPSPTSRTAIQQVAHAAWSITGIRDWLSGKPFPFKDVNELDTKSRAMEKEYTTRESVIKVLDDNSEGYIAWIESLTPEQLASTISLPFGDFKLADAITFCADHLRSHASQIEYMQTIYGDLDWHIG